MFITSVFLLTLCVHLSSQQLCSDTPELQAVELSYKTYEDHVLYGSLGACPRQGELLSNQLTYSTNDITSGVTITNQNTGEFLYRPTRHHSGVVTFLYTVQDYRGISEPAQVSINFRPVSDTPILRVAPAIGEEDSFISLSIWAQLQDYDGSEELKVSLCDCNAIISCSSGICTCPLTIPTGWTFLTGDMQMSVYHLQQLSRSHLESLRVRPAPDFYGKKCFKVVAMATELQRSRREIAYTSQTLDINVRPVNDLPTLTANSANGDVLVTSEGRPVQFYDLTLTDIDSDDGSYIVTVRLDDGGELWVQRNVPGVVFYPDEESIAVATEMDPPRINDDESFYSFYSENSEYLQLSRSNNGRHLLNFTGSLAGVNRVLSTLLYVPWCSQWPIPPNWNLPEDFWMIPSADDLSWTDDFRYPNIWPAWYPKFWYPFPTKVWSWQPRVLAPYWLDRVCSDWTSHVDVEVKEMPSTNECCRDEEYAAIRKSFSINVEAKTAPKSLIPGSIFSYFSEEASHVDIQGLYMKTLQDQIHLSFIAHVERPGIAHIESTPYESSQFTCASVEECNNALQNLRVYFTGPIADVCNLRVWLDVFDYGSTMPRDMLTVWVVKSTPQCVNVMENHPDFTLPQSRQIVAQGSYLQPLPLPLHVDVDNIQEGLLHVNITSEHGYVSMDTPTGVRIFSDHMGVHGVSPTNLCLAAPTGLVVQALRTLKFTPMAHFTGSTTVTIEYGVPRTAQQLAYGSRDHISRQSITIDIQVQENLFKIPSIHIPAYMCATEGELTVVRDIVIGQRYSHGDDITISLTAHSGELHVDASRLAGLDIEVSSSHGTYISLHGPLDAINTAIRRDMFRYRPSSCIERSLTQGGAVDVSVRDSINIYVQHNSGQSTSKTLLVDICCQEMNSIDRNSADEEACIVEHWGDWSVCNSTSCQVGVQHRQRNVVNIDPIYQCPPAIEERPCLMCQCEPILMRMTTTTEVLSGCTSEQLVYQCPADCAPSVYHTEFVDFRCEGDNTNRSTMKSLVIHEQCICDSCLF